MATTASPQSDYSEGPSVELPPSLSSLDLAAFSRLTHISIGIMWRRLMCSA